MRGGSQLQRLAWYKPRYNMDKRRSCANCGSVDHHVADCTTYKQGMKRVLQHEFYSGFIIKIDASSFFFSNQESYFRMDCPLFWEVVQNQNHTN